MRKILFLVVLAISISGCSTLFDGIGYDRNAGLAVVSNSERNFVVDYGSGEKGAKVRRCLEAPGPAALLNNFKLDTELSGSSEKLANGKFEVDVTNTQSIAKLYEVSSVLQYAHAMTYRLCEATINGFVDEAEFGENFGKINETTTRLIELQLRLAQEDTKKAQESTKQAKLDLEKARLEK